MAADRSTVKVAFVGDASSLARAAKHAQGEMGRINKAAVAAGAGAAIAGIALAKFGKSSLNAFQDAGRRAMGVQRLLGGTAEEASRLAFAADRTGVGVEGLSIGLRTLSKNLVNSANKTTKLTTKVAVATGAWRKQTTIIKDANGEFRKVTQMVPVTKMQSFTRVVAKANPILAKLGFNVRDANGKLLPMSALLPKIADRFKNMPDGAEKTALAMQLFGRSGVALLPFLNKGAAGLKELEKQSDRLGQTMSGKDLDAIRKSAAAHRDFSAAMKGLKIQVGRELFPVMAKFSSYLASQGVPAILRFGNVLTHVLRPAVAWIIGVLDRTMPKVNEFIKGFQGKLDGTKFAEWGGKARRAFDDVKVAVVDQVIPAFRTFLREAASLGSTIGEALTPALLSLADVLLKNARFVVPLTAVLLAAKGVMMAYQGVTTAVTTAQEIWTSVTRIATVTQRFFFTTTVAATGATRASTLSKIADKIASATLTVQIWALIVAEKARAIATAVSTAALKLQTAWTGRAAASTGALTARTVASGAAAGGAAVGFRAMGVAMSAALGPALLLAAAMLNVKQNLPEKYAKMAADPKIMAKLGQLGISKVMAPELLDNVSPQRMHAKGGRLAEGWNIVGEEGAELAHHGAGGTEIFSNSKSRQMLGSGRGGGDTILHVYGLLDDAMLRKIETMLARVKRQRGTPLAFES